MGRSIGGVDGAGNTQPARNPHAIPKGKLSGGGILALGKRAMASSDGPGQFATLLHRCRLAAGLSQDELAERAGLSARGISDLERGVRRMPYLATVRRLADALAVSEVDRARLLTAARGELDETLTSPAAARPTHTAAPQRSDPPNDEPRQTSQASRTNLPHERGKLIGRERELTQLAALLRREDVGLVTLTGAGGSGKTRLAIAVASELVDDFQDGVFLAVLAPLTDASAVIPNIAQALGIRDIGERPLLEVLTDALRRKHILLVLDNFEHVRAAAVAVGSLLRACERLKLLVTSRAPLARTDEHEFSVPPLALPDRDHLPPVRALAQCASVRLFCE